jgi:hypothetical protein
MPNNIDNITLHQLLLKVIQLLKNMNELYDTMIELNASKRFLLEKVVGSDEEIRFWTGFPSYSSLQYFINYLVLPNVSKIKYWGANNKEDSQDDAIKCGPKRAMGPEDELFMTLVKLRQGSATQDLAERFHISPSHVSRIFITWINILFNILTSIDIWMSKKKVKQTLPRAFKGFQRLV